MGSQNNDNLEPVLQLKCNESDSEYSLHFYEYNKFGKTENNKRRCDDFLYYDDATTYILKLLKDNKPLVPSSIKVNGVCLAITQKPNDTFSLSYNNQSEDTNIATWGYQKLDIKITLPNSAENLSFETNDIIIEDEGTRKFLNDIINKFFPSWDDEPKINQAQKIMFKDWFIDNQFSLLQCNEEDESGPKSFKAFFDYIEKTIAKYKEVFPAFYMHANNKQVENYIICNYDKAKRIGRKEITWLTKNLWALSEQENGPIEVDGKEYKPFTIQLDLQKKSFDTYENRVVINWLVFLKNKLNFIINQMSLYDKPNDDEIIPTWLELLHEKIRGNSSEITTLAEKYQDELKNLIVKYHSLFNDVSHINLMHKPRCTKVFQEKVGYRDIYDCINKYFDIANAKTQDHKLDKVLSNCDLYEYFGLYTIIDTIIKNGYRLNSHNLNKYKCKYKWCHNNQTLADKKCLINHFFSFKASPSSKNASIINLYYQPIFNSINIFQRSIQAKTKNEIKAERRRIKHELDKIDDELKIQYRKLWCIDGRSWFQPDYLIEIIENNKVTKQIILDAKYKVNNPSNNNFYEISNARDCYVKYMQNTASCITQKADKLIVFHFSDEINSLIKNGRKDAIACFLGPENIESFTNTIGKQINPNK